MRAVNLIPEDARRGGGAGTGGRSGGTVYVLLGGLAVLVALVGAWAFTGRTVSHKRAELDAIQARIAQAQAQAPAQTAQQVQGSPIDERLATVRALVTARQDWARTLDAIARTLPANTSLSTLDAATTPSASTGAGSSGGLASSSTGPSIQIAGCAPSQKAVAQLMPRLKVIPGVQDVTLGSATVSASGGTTGAAGAASGCKTVDFEMVLFLQTSAPPAATPPAAATAAAAPAPATTPGATQ